MTTSRIGRGNDRPVRGVAAEEVRRHNLSLVLDRLHVRGPLSRSTLTAIAGLNRSTIADLVAELGRLGLAEEGPGLNTSGPGRPSPLVSPRPEGAVVVAVDLAVDSIGIAAVGLGGHVFDSVRVGRPYAQTAPQETLSDAAGLVGSMVASLPKGHRLVGIGVAVVGIARRADGLVHFAPNLGWRDVPLAKMLAEELGVNVPVLVANDADLGALAEHRRGVAVGVGHVIYVGGEVGIGIGVIAGGRPMLGSHGYGGEAGHMLVNPEGELCQCGSVGCWEVEAGEAALLRRSEIATGSGLDAIEEIERRAEAGDPVVLRALEDTGRWVGLGIANLINIFNPEMVVLGGTYQRFYRFIGHVVQASAVARSLDMPGRLVELEASSLGADATLIGAAELALSGVIEDPGRVTGTHG